MSHLADKSRATSVHAALLGLFTMLFGLRVAAQLVQYASPTRFLPPFDAWQGSGLEYPVLLLGQVVILPAMASGAVAVRHGARARKSVGNWLVVLGVVYFGAMSARLVLGLAMLADVAWFAKPLPALFHMVLAGYVLTLGHYHRRHE